MGRDLAAVWTMTVAFTKRYFRDKVAIFFTFLFQIVFLVIFGFIFGGNESPNFSVALLKDSTSEFSTQFIERTSESELFTFEEGLMFEEAEEQLGRGEIDGIIKLPEDFGEAIDEGYPAGQLELFYDQGDEQLFITMQATLQGIFDGINQELVTPITKPIK